MLKTRFVAVLGAVETTVDGRVTGEIIEQMAADYAKHEKSTGLWFIRAEEVTAYSPDAIRRAVVRFDELRTTNGLTCIITILLNPVVRMGASVVSMGLRSAGSPVEILVCASVDEALTVITTRRKMV